MYYNLVFFLTKLLTLGILFSTAVNAASAAKPLTLGILFSISTILALKPNFLTSSLVSGVFFSNSNLSVSYLVFKANHFLLNHLAYLNQQD